MNAATSNITAIATLVFGALACARAGATENGRPPENVEHVMSTSELAPASAPSTGAGIAWAAPTADAASPSGVAATTQPEEQPEPLVSDDERGQDDRSWAGQPAIALSESRLDAMRGGFDLPSGLKVSFGLSRVAFVNGNMVTTTSFNIPDVSQMTAQQAQMLAAANMGALIQVGNGNAVQAGALPPLAGSVIQNTLNNQHIQALTTINTSVNTLSMFKTLNIMSTLNDALTTAVRGK